MDRSDSARMTRQLCEVLLSLRDPEETLLFLQDLCTPKEVEYMAQRVEAARLLMHGLTYQEVTDRISISSATLTRVSKCLRADLGYRRVLSRLDDTSEKSCKEESPA